MKNRKTTKRE